MSPRESYKKAQAAIELAVFGAILIFILGTIVRSSVGNGYAQNQNFKAMRLAMLYSWLGSEAHPGKGHAQDISHNNASVLFVEDRLSPDFNKYGDLERNPYIAQGSGTFSYNLFYPVDQSEAGANVPVMDVYVNGLHFPFTTASYVTSTISQPSCGAGGPFPPPPYGPPLTPAQRLQNQCLRNQREWKDGHKLFYTIVANGDTANFSPVPPGSCEGINKALCASLTLQDVNGTPFTNTNGDMQYDLLRFGNYTSPLGTYPSVESRFPPVSSCSDAGVTPNMRCYIAWQWAATVATDAASIGLKPKDNQYPSYDIDGRLKEVTIYDFKPPNVSYEDFQGGDIDATWDSNSYGPKPGLQSNSQIFTFTKDGTYLQIKEGQLYNPETDLYVRSANKRNTIDLIQRVIQLSNNTGRFCNGASLCSGANCANPNPVEVCIPVGSSDNCFSTQQNIKSTCYDENSNKIFVRSRVEDRRGHFWMTDTSGQLKVQ